jgi:hypothetical protein
MAIEIVQSLAIEFGWGACNMFLESSCQTQYVMIEGDKKFNC